MPCLPVTKCLLPNVRRLRLGGRVTGQRGRVTGQGGGMMDLGQTGHCGGTGQGGSLRTDCGGGRARAGLCGRAREGL